MLYCSTVCFRKSRTRGIYFSSSSSGTSSGLVSEAETLNTFTTRLKQLSCKKKWLKNSVIMHYLLLCGYMLRPEERTTTFPHSATFFYFIAELVSL